MILEQFKSIRNQLDFFIRSRLRFSRPIDPHEPTHDHALKLQNEVEEFIKQFSWKPLNLKFQNTFRVLDVGARTFAFGPVFERFFLSLGLAAEVHGIEIDAYRRFTDFRSRADYGHYYASQMQSGAYHAMDFLEWKAPSDLIFLLHPFVTVDPLMSWGLPPQHFKPQRLFEHCYALLKPRQGHMLLSCPTPEEIEISLRLAENVGFKVLERRDWLPKEESNQKQSRLGILFSAH